MSILTKAFRSVFPPPQERGLTYTRIYVERNPRGGWSLRVSGDTEQLGNYPTAHHAERIARANCQHVVVLDDPVIPQADGPIYELIER